MTQKEELRLMKLADQSAWRPGREQELLDYVKGLLEDEYVRGHDVGYTECGEDLANGIML